MDLESVASLMKQAAEVGRGLSGLIASLPLQEEAYSMASNLVKAGTLPPGDLEDRAALFANDITAGRVHYQDLMRLSPTPAEGQKFASMGADADFPAMPMTPSGSAVPGEPRQSFEQYLASPIN